MEKGFEDGQARRELLALPRLVNQLGDRPVGGSTTLVLTRFGVRRPGDLLQTYLDFKDIQPSLKLTPEGLLKAAFLLESPRSCFSLSLWASEAAIARFGAEAEAHTRAARRVFPRLRFSGRRPELWSTKWRLTSVSHNLNWDGAPIVPGGSGSS